MKRFLCLCVSTRHAEASSSYCCCCCCCCCWNVWKIEAKSKGQKRTDRNKKRGKLVVRVDLYIPHSYNTQIKKKAKREAKICEKKQSRSKGDVDVVSLFGLYLFSLFFYLIYILCSLLSFSLSQSRRHSPRLWRTSGESFSAAGSLRNVSIKNILIKIPNS